jgi:hypothetical protein
MEILLKQAEEDQDHDLFVVSMKIVSLRWWMSHLQVGQSFSTTCGVLRYLLHNLQIIGLKFIKIQEQEKCEKEERREKARETVSRGRTDPKLGNSKVSTLERKKVEKIRDPKLKKSSRSSKSKSTEEKEDSGQGTSSGEELKQKKIKKEKKSKKSKSDKSDDGDSEEKKRKKKEKKERKRIEESAKEPAKAMVIRITKVINKDHLVTTNDKLSTISEESDVSLFF